MPTETVYGLAADACSPLAVRRIFAAKGRPADHPVIVHLESAASAQSWGHWSDTAQALAEAFWPGPLTVVLPRAGHVLDEVTGGLPTVGLRVPAHPVAHELLAAFGGGLAAPSANPFGTVSPTSAAHVRAAFGADLMVLDGGPCTVGLESSIVDLSGPTPALLRPGGVPRRALEAIVGTLGQAATPAPGTLRAHYAPRTSLLLTDDVLGEVARLKAAGRSVAVLPAGPGHAQRLYAELRRLDRLGVDLLVAERSHDLDMREAINDRLSRAATGSREADPGSGVDE